MSHLHALSLKAALHIEALISLRAIEYSFVTPHVSRYVVHGVNDPQPKLLALLISRNGDVFDVADKPHITNAAIPSSASASFVLVNSNLQFALNNNRTSSHNFLRSIQYD